MPKQTNDYMQKVIDQLINVTGLKNLPQKEEEMFRRDLEAQINRRLGLIILKNLDDKGLKEYEKMISKKEKVSPGEFQAFLEKYLPNYEEVIDQEMETFWQEVFTALTS